MTSLPGMKQGTIMSKWHQLLLTHLTVIEAKKKGLLELRRGKVKSNTSGRERVERERCRYVPGSPSRGLTWNARKCYQKETWPFACLFRAS